MQFAKYLRMQGEET